VPLTPRHHHAWDLGPADAEALQLSLAGKVELADRFGEIALVAGIDIGFEQAGAVTQAAVAVLRLPDLVRVDHQVAR
jgi:deoxyribonuclease V